MTQSCRVESDGSARCRRLWEMERRYVGDAWHDGMTIVGVDEAGRGCLAGPVVAAAVVLGKPVHTWVGIDDSKCLTRRRREQLCDWIREQARAVGVGWASVEEIDNLNILHASRLAMTRAVQCLPVQPDVTLVDGPYAPLEAPPEWHCQPVIDGDAQCLSIAAASIVAKVVRDRFMAELANTYPEFGFDRNAGYGTREHRQALARFGPTPYHRRSFAPVARHLQMRLALDG